MRRSNSRAVRTSFAKKKLRANGDRGEVEGDYRHRVSVFGLSLPFRVLLRDSNSSVSFVLREQASSKVAIVDGFVREVARSLG